MTSERTNIIHSGLESVTMQSPLPEGHISVRPCSCLVQQGLGTVSKAFKIH